TQYPAWPATTPTLVTSYAYNRGGDRTRLTDPLGHVTTYTYDAVNRLTAIAYDDGVTPGVSYAYDANGNRVQMDDGTGTTTYGYDEVDRLVAVVGPGAVTVGYRYDLDGNRVKLVYPDGTMVSYAFDEASRLLSLVDWAGRVTSYGYGPEGSLATAAMPNGTRAGYGYDNALRLTRVWNQGGAQGLSGQLGSEGALLGEVRLGGDGGGLGTISRHSYTVDAVGNRTGGDEALPRLGAPGPMGSMFGTSYAYDRLYRLIEATDPEVSTTYGFDSVGNRLSMTRGSTTAYAYDRADRILAAGATSYTVDAKGNTTGRGADRFGYDQANRLVSGTVGGEASAYAYDGDGKRASKTVDGDRTEYVYDVNRALAVVLEDGARKYVWGLGLAYAEDEETGEIAVYHTDGLGSVRAITNADGAVVQTYRTDEYGVPVAASGAIAQPFQYTGEQRDEETGFVYLRARMYEPEIGRFVQYDSNLGGRPVTSSVNRYSYVDNNPVSRVDPTGRKATVLRL